MEAGKHDREATVTLTQKTKVMRAKDRRDTSVNKTP
jgi:hypothetical protein